MRHTLEQIWDETHRGYALLKTLRDELRLELHLAGMDAQTRWHTDLEPRFLKAEAALARLETSARSAIAQLLRDYETFRACVAMEGPRGRRRRR
jgi:hypothetical protein